MERSGERVEGVGPAEAADLVRLLEAEGPFVTVHLTTESSLDNAAHRSMQHWRAVRDDLEQQGAPSAALDAVEALVPDAHLDGPGWFCVAAGGKVLLATGLPAAPARDRGVVGALPSIVPLVDHRQRHVPHIVVLADRTGADILVGTATVVAGLHDAGDPAIRKSAPGGWSQHRYQERAERTWEDNAKAVAERVADAARLVDPAVILVAGETRALGYLQEHLEPRLSALVREVDGSRGADGGDDIVVEAARKQVATVAAEATRALLEKFREEQGQHDRAADGVDATIEALNAARVDTLLLADDLDDDRTAWCSSGDGDAVVVGRDRASVESLGGSAASEARLADVLVAAAFRTGARVRVVPRTTVTDGVGAILRY